MSRIDKSVIRINKDIMAINSSGSTEQAKIHLGINPSLYFMNNELKYVQRVNMAVRKKKLRELLIEDFLDEDKQLRRVGMACINSQP